MADANVNNDKNTDESSKFERRLISTAALLVFLIVSFAIVQ